MAASTFGRVNRLRRSRSGPYSICATREAPTKKARSGPSPKARRRAQAEATSGTPAPVVQPQATPAQAPHEDRSAVCRASACKGREALSLTDLADGPYLVLAHWLDAASLCSADAVCRRLLRQNNATIGPWRTMGARAFHGLELQEHGVFEAEEVMGRCDGQMLVAPWKARYRRFKAQLLTFCAPFSGPEILTVKEPDEVAYFQCHLRPDVLSLDERAAGIYLEVAVKQNADNLSIALVDFEAGGCSSVTFSPDTGAVIREKKVQELPRRVEGEFIQPLQALPFGERFHGLLGLELRAGRLAFFRRWERRSTGEGEEPAAAAAKPGKAAELGPWESTGFVTDLSWAAGRRLTPCLAFRGKGVYEVCLVKIGSQPGPAQPEASGGEGATGELQWSSLDWEAEAELEEAPEA